MSNDIQLWLRKKSKREKRIAQKHDVVHSKYSQYTAVNKGHISRTKDVKMNFADPKSERIHLMRLILLMRLWTKLLPSEHVIEQLSCLENHGCQFQSTCCHYQQPYGARAASIWVIFAKTTAISPKSLKWNSGQEIKWTYIWESLTKTECLFTHFAPYWILLKQRINNKLLLRPW